MRKFIFGIIGLVIILFAGRVLASVSSLTENQWLNWCNANSSVCTKVTEKRSSVDYYEVSCPSSTQIPETLLVPAGNGETVYVLPHEGYGYDLGEYNANVTRLVHPHDMNWVMLVCKSAVPTPTLEPTSTPTPTVTLTSVPEPTSTPTPTVEVPIEIVKLDLQGGGTPPTFPHDEGVSRNECHGSLPKEPILAFQRIDSTTVKFSWWPMNNINHFALIFGYKNESEMGVPNIVGNANEITVSGLSPNTSVFGRLWAEQADYCGSWSSIVSDQSVL